MEFRTIKILPSNSDFHIKLYFLLHFIVLIFAALWELYSKNLELAKLKKRHVVS